MAIRTGSAISGTFPPPVMEARRWLEGVDFPKDRPLINLSQAAPVEPPPQEMRQELSRVIVEEPLAHAYGPVLGLGELREALADKWRGWYGSNVSSDNVAITSGCNQAFCAAIAALADPGDDVILPLPWYFNHKMLLDMNSIKTQLLPPGANMLPDPKAAEALIGPRTRAIALVSPNNPTGAEYSPTLLAAFRDIARKNGIALIVDETYRDFHSTGPNPHDLLSDPDWSDTVIQLYSFSKVFRLTGHRVGAMIASPPFLREVEKYLDTIAICPNQIGQFAALYGLNKLDDWVAAEREEILRRRAAVDAAFSDHPTFELLSSGAYFAFLRHKFGSSSGELAPKLVTDASILMLPGTMFAPAEPPEVANLGTSTFRAAFANAPAAQIDEFAARLAVFDP